MNDDALVSALNGIMDASMNNIKKRPADYYKDGLLICGLCNTPKQKQLDAMIGDSRIIRVVGCLCKCEEERVHKDREERERQEDGKNRKVAALGAVEKEGRRHGHRDQDRPEAQAV